jgi:pseudouridine-5'-phosphate glycosidase
LLSASLIRGRADAGLSPKELEHLIDSQRAVKLSRRDLAPAVVNKWHGSTTVAATSYLAHLVGIRVFATGGIGGVHREGHNSLDVSADLTELARVSYFRHSLLNADHVGRRRRL